jgi:hypothetical protein
MRALPSADTELLKRLNVRTETEEPMAVKLRILAASERRTKERIETLEPSDMASSTDNAEPKRPKLLIETLEPSVRKSSTEFAPAPAVRPPKTDTLLPKEAMRRKLSELPRLT